MSIAGLSLIVASKGQCNPRNFLNALADAGIEDAEDVDVHISYDDFNAASLVSLPKNLRLWPCQPEASIFNLWANGIAQSQREFLAILDIDCPPGPGWLQCVRHAIGQRNDIFFGPVIPFWRSDDNRIVGYLVEYAQFHPPLDRQIKEVPGNNLVFHRDLLPSPQTLQSEGFIKTHLLWRLADEGHPPPASFHDMVVCYRREFNLRSYLIKRYRHGRGFAANRRRAAGQPSRWLCIAFTPFLGFLRVWRIYRAVRDKHELKKAFFHYFGVIFLAEQAWSIGEFYGYAFGDRRPQPLTHDLRAKGKT